MAQQPRLDKQVETKDKANAHKRGISFYCFKGHPGDKYNYIFIESPKIKK